MPKVIRKARLTEGAIRLGHGQFVRFVSQRFGVSQEAFKEALKILKKGIRQALSEGYAVMIEELVTFEVRELKERKRINPKTKQKYIHGASCRVHAKPSATLTRDVLRLSQERIDKFQAEHPIADPEPKKRGR